ncbi:MAG: hypothetical protein ACXAC7_22220, partial [Candidatus Hodarchaeales archaeon]
NIPPNIKIEAKESDFDLDDHVGEATITFTFGNSTTTYDLENRDDQDIDAQIQITVTSIEVSQNFKSVLVIDWLADPWLKYIRKLITIPPFDNTQENNFWSLVNQDPGIEVFLLPPTNALLSLDTPNIINYLEILNPDVIIIANLGIDMYNRWGLDEEERKAIFDYLTQGHGLILTGNTLFDMRLKTHAVDLSVGSYDHIGRLDLGSKTLLEIAESYRTSLASMAGLGLLPLFEEARELIGDSLSNNPNPILQAIAPVVYSAPLMPFGVPFSGMFNSANSSDPLLSSLSSEFSVNITCQLKIQDPLYCGQFNTTSVGWQLEYPFLMAERLINQLDTFITHLEEYLHKAYSSIIEKYHENAKITYLGTLTKSIIPTDLDLNLSIISDFVHNITNNLQHLMHSLHEMRMNVPSEITIPISFSIAGLDISFTITVPIPVEIQQLLRPAEIVAESSDGRAAILKYELANYRSVYFSFNPILGNDTSLQLIKNAIHWTGTTTTPIATTTIGDYLIPTNLINQIENSIDVASLLTYNQTKVLKENETGVFTIKINDTSGSINIYTEEPNATINVQKDGQDITGSTLTTSGTKSYLYTDLITGEYNITVSMNDTKGLVGSFALVVYESPTQISEFSIEMVIIFITISFITIFSIRRFKNK